MGNQISIGTITLITHVTIVLALAMVAAVLFLLIRTLVSKKADTLSEKHGSMSTLPGTEPGGAVSSWPVETGDTLAKVAAVCAAVAATMDGKAYRLVGIRRLPPRNLWLQSAREESIKSEGMLRHWR